MRITTGNKTIEYSITAGGNFMEKQIIGDDVLVRATPNVQRFLEWIIGPAEKTICQKYKVIDVIAVWWGLKDSGSIRGSFNMDHYKKVMQARQAKGI